MTRDVCQVCREHADTLDWWTLRGSCASVGIEFGKTTDEMMVDYWRGFHRRHGSVDDGC